MAMEKGTTRVAVIHVQYPRTLKSWRDRKHIEHASSETDGNGRDGW